MRAARHPGRPVPTCNGPARGSHPAVPEPSEPGRRLGELGVRGTRAYLCTTAVVARVAAEEPHLGTHPAQAHQRLADPGVVEVALAVDGEAVLAEPVAGGPGLDTGQVDAAHRELGEQFHQ